MATLYKPISLFVLGTGLLFQSAFAEVTTTTAKAKILGEFLQSFEEGAYPRALGVLEEAPPEIQNNGEISYWKGLTLTKLQRFDLAIKPLSHALASADSVKFKDLNYLLAQSYYSLQNFEAAKPLFLASARLGYQKAQSLYYLGYLQKETKDEKAALDSFKEIVKDDTGDLSVRQTAQYQIGEIRYDMSKKMPLRTDLEKAKRRVRLLEFTVPDYNLAIELDEKSAIAAQAQLRINEIKKIFGLETPRTLGGVIKPIKNWSIRLTEDAKYDSNIVNESTGKLVKVAHTDSFLSKTSTLIKYEGTWWNRFVITPEVGADYTIHFRRNNPSVFTNDAASVTPALRTRTDHMIKGKSASVLAEYEYNYGWRDFQYLHKLLYYSKYHAFIIGERFEPFSFGQTTLKFQFKFALNNNKAQNYLAPKISVSQTINIGNNAVTLGGTFEKQRAKDTSNDQRNYGITSSLSLPSLPFKFAGDLAFAMSWTDTMNQIDARGIEKNISPSITLTRSFGEESKFSGNVNYAYTRNLSKDTVNYDYKKHVVGIGASYTF